MAVRGFRSSGARAHGFAGTALVAFLLLSAGAALAQSQQQAPPPGSILFSEFLQYRKLVSEELKEYKEFLQLTITAGLVVLTTLFGFLNWKTRSDVKKEVSAQLSATISQTISQMIQEKAPEIRHVIATDMTKSVADLKMHFDQAMEERKNFVDRWLIDLSAGPSSPRVEQELTLEELVQGKRILWVDDNPANNNPQVEILETMRARVEQVTSTADAVGLIERGGGYDLIISDMNRPNQGLRAGIDLVDKLKDRSRIIIYCGASSLRRHGSEAVAHGAFAVTATNQALFSAITAAFRGKEAPGVIMS